MQSYFTIRVVYYPKVVMVKSALSAVTTLSVSLHWDISQYISPHTELSANTLFFHTKLCVNTMLITVSYLPTPFSSLWVGCQHLSLYTDLSVNTFLLTLSWLINTFLLTELTVNTILLLLSYLPSPFSSQWVRCQHLSPYTELSANTNILRLSYLPTPLSSHWWVVCQQFSPHTEFIPVNTFPLTLSYLSTLFLLTLNCLPTLLSSH